MLAVGQPLVLYIGDSQGHYHFLSTCCPSALVQSPRDGRCNRLTAIFFGTNISTFSLANISSFEARELVLANMTNTTLTLDVDGCKLDPYQNALIATSPGEEFTLPVVFSSDNDVLQGNFDAAQAGYYALLAPFKQIGKHTIHFSVFVTRTGPAAAAATLGLLPSFTFNEVTYYLNVV